MRILTVYAHPDDESFGPAAVLARYVGQGAQLDGLWFTRGQHGQPTQDPPPPAAELAAVRERDLREVAALIGYRSVDVRDYEDGTLAEVPRLALEQTIAEAIRRFQPDVLLTFGPAGITGHADHRAVHRAVLAAFTQARTDGAPVSALFYDAVAPEIAARFGIGDQPDGQPNTFVDVRATQHIKREALAIHARHVADAVERLKRLEREPLPEETLHRAWPLVAAGRRLTDLLSA